MVNMNEEAASRTNDSMRVLEEGITIFSALDHAYRAEQADPMVGRMVRNAVELHEVGPQCLKRNDGGLVLSVLGILFRGVEVIRRFLWVQNFFPIFRRESSRFVVFSGLGLVPRESEAAFATLDFVRRSIGQPVLSPFLLYDLQHWLTQINRNDAVSTVSERECGPSRTASEIKNGRIPWCMS